ncbi:hypothetical protein QDY65_03855 [Pyrococcus kukulkanii]|uniref:hypothetical protein n=1 Tax=Pyrococcus kukulkanii TaxID=1609559 RepID=UPI00356791C8
MNSTKKMGLMILIFSFIMRVITLPQSIGYAYGPAHFYNLYLPNLGVESAISILPNYFRTLLTGYIYLKVMLELFGDPLLVYRILYIVQPLLTFSGYLLFFSLIPQFKKPRFIFASILSLIIYWPSEQYLVGALVLGMTALFGILSQNTNLILIGYLSLVSVSLYWHSASVLFAVFLFSFLLIRYLDRHSKRDMFQLLMVSLISVWIWVYVRGHYQKRVFELFLGSLLNITEYFNVNYLKVALFSKGIVAPPEFVYDKYGQVGAILNYIKYVGYINIILIIFLIIFVYPLLTLSNKIVQYYIMSLNKQLMLLAVSLILGAIIHTILSFLVLKTIGSIVFIVFLFPYTIAYMWKTYSITKRKFYIGVLIYLLFSIGLPEAYSTYYVEIKTNPRFNERFELYNTYSMWIGKHFNNGSYLISDAATIGYISIWFGKDKLYKQSEIHFKSFDNNDYISIRNGKWNKHHFVIYNFKLYIQNLPFYSLQAWNLYKPIPPEEILKNPLNKLYDSKNLWILQGIPMNWSGINRLK